jgi:hypothetical protein
MHIGSTLPSSNLDGILRGHAVQISQREVQDADISPALTTAPADRNRFTALQHALREHAALTVALPQQLPRLWPGLEQHILATLAC